MPRLPEGTHFLTLSFLKERVASPSEPGEVYDFKASQSVRRKPVRPRREARRWLRHNRSRERDV